MSSDTKECTSCHEEKSAEDFYKTSSGAHASQCKSCKIAAVARRQAERYEQDAAYRKSKIRRVTTRQATRYKTDPQYRDKAIARVGIQQARRYESDPNFRVSKCISSAIRESLLSQKHGRAWETLVGYTSEQLSEHLERLFQPGMTWDNYGEWHIDHIIPRRHFQYSSASDKEFQDCWSLSNLQPLWSAENIAKSDKLPTGRRARHVKKIST